MPWARFSSWRPWSRGRTAATVGPCRTRGCTPNDPPLVALRPIALSFPEAVELLDGSYRQVALVRVLTALEAR